MPKYGWAVCQRQFKTRPHSHSVHSHDGDLFNFFFLGARPKCKLHRSKRKECTRKGSPEEIRHLNRIRKRKETKRRRDAVKDCRSYHYEEMISQDIPIDFVNRNSEQVSVVNMGGRQLYFPMPSDIDRYNSLKWKISIFISIESALVCSEANSNSKACANRKFGPAPHSLNIFLVWVTRTSYALFLSDQQGDYTGGKMLHTGTLVTITGTSQFNINNNIFN